MRVSFKSVVLLSGLLFTGSPALAEMFELKVKPNPPPQTKTEIQSDDPTQKSQTPKPRPLAQCSQDYHASLRTILKSDWERLDAAHKSARKTDKRLPGTVMVAPLRTDRSSEEKRTLLLAARAAKFRGRAPWLTRDNPGWVIRQMITDLKIYFSQSENPFLCTGSKDYVTFLGKYVSTAEKAAGEAEALSDAQMKRAGLAFNSAWYGMRPPAVPVASPQRPKPVFSMELDLRTEVLEALETGNGGEALEDHGSSGLDGRTTNSTLGKQEQLQAQPPDVDLPPLSERELAVPLDDTNEIARAINALLKRSYDLGFLEPPSFVEVKQTPKANSQSSGENTDRLIDPVPELLSALANAREAFKFNARRKRASPLVLRRTREAISALEVQYYIGTKRSQMRSMADSLKSTIERVSTAQKSDCSCLR